MALATDPVTLALATKATREANAIGCPHPSKLPVWHSLRSPWLPLFYALSPGQMVVGPDYSLPECVLGQLAAARWSQELQRSLVLAEGGPDVIMHGAKGLLIGRVVPSSLGHPILEPILGHSDSLSQELVLLNLCRTSLGALCSVVASRLRSSNGLDITWRLSSEAIPSAVRYTLELPAAGLSFYEAAPHFRADEDVIDDEDKSLSLDALTATHTRIVGSFKSLLWKGKYQYCAIFLCLAPARSDVVYWRTQYVPRHLKCVDDAYVILTSARLENRRGSPIATTEAYSVVYRQPPLTASDHTNADGQSWAPEVLDPVFEREWLQTIPDADMCFLADPVVLAKDNGWTVRFDLIARRKSTACSSSPARQTWWIYQATYAVDREGIADAPMKEPHLAEITSWPDRILIFSSDVPRFYIFEDDIVVYHRCVCRENNNSGSSFLLHRLPASPSVANQECTSKTVLWSDDGRGDHRWDPFSGIGVGFRFDYEWESWVIARRVTEPTLGENYAVLFDT